MNGPNNAIGWCDYTWNPVTGCKLGCKFGASGARCYAEGIARRFAGGKAFPNGFEPTFHPNRLDEPLRVKTPSRVFVSSMGELFGPWVPEEWRQAVLDAIRRAPQHRFIMLTKVPRIARRYTMPDNVWLGTTITGDLPHEARRLAYVREFQAPVRFLSIEPLVAPVDVSAADPDWLIIAAATGPGGFQPQEPWVRALEDYADERGIPVYEKDNLNVRPVKRQEWPSTASTIGHPASLLPRAASRHAEGLPVVLDGACRPAADRIGIL
jgi:protein gp37